MPSQLLAVNRAHYVYLNTPITDVAGNHLPGSFNTFVTGLHHRHDRADAAAGKPADRRHGVGRNARVVLQFDRADQRRDARQGVLLQTGGVTVPGTSCWRMGSDGSGSHPASQLAASTTYTSR